VDNFRVNSIGRVNISEEGAYIKLESKYVKALQALDGFSHLNIVWWFSNYDTEERRNIIEAPTPYKNAPPVMGIFATRSPFRPNPIALSTVQIIQIDHIKGTIQITYIDAENNTPILDIKPYTPSLDRVETPSVPEWCSHWPKSLELSENFDWKKEFLF